MNKKAFTLFEILIALIILSFTTVGLLNVLLASKRHSMHSRSRTTGGELGRYFMDPMALQVRQDQWGNNCLSNNTLCTSGYPGPTINNMTYSLPVYVISVVPGTNLRKVVAKIQWKES